MLSGRKAVTQRSNELAPHRCLAAKRTCENLLHAGGIFVLIRAYNDGQIGLIAVLPTIFAFSRLIAKKNSDYFQISIDKTATADYNTTNIVCWCKNYQADAACTC